MIHRSRAVRAFHAAPHLPGDKSITHRAYLLGLLAAGSYQVTGGNPGEDCRATLSAVRELGVRVDETVDGVRIEGAAGALRDPGSALDLGNSGTGLRLLLGAVAGQSFAVTLTGDDSLRSRPMNRVLQPLSAMGVRTASREGLPPVTLTGGRLRPFQGELPVPSAQVKSAILLAAIQAEGETRIAGDRGTRDHTERLLRYFGVQVNAENGVVTVTGPACPVARDIHVPGDPSAGAFFAAGAALVPGASTTLENLGMNPGRIAYLDVLETMGVAVARTITTSDPEPVGVVTVTHQPLQAVDLSPDRVPGVIDELPVLAVLAAFATGTSTFRGAKELKVKESDRLATVAAGLRAIGAQVELLPDGWRIRGSGGEPLPGGRVTTHGDHRVGMAFLVAGLRCADGVELADAPRIETSDPYFINNLNEILETTS